MNKAFILGFVLQVCVVYIPGIRDIFEFYPIPFQYFLITIGLSLIMVVIMEVVKLVNRIRTKKQ